jgi:uncharacterized membrane protein YfcA
MNKTTSFYLFLALMLIQILAAIVVAFSAVTYVFEGYGLVWYLAAPLTIICVLGAYISAHIADDCERHSKDYL